MDAKIRLHNNHGHNPDELKKKKENLSKMVIVNGIVYFCSHMPKFVTTLLLIIYASKLKKFCTERISCDLINEEAEFFVVFSMLGNFYIFKCFNANFSESYADLKSRLIYPFRRRRRQRTVEFIVLSRLPDLAR